MDSSLLRPYDIKRRECLKRENLAYYERLHGKPVRNRVPFFQREKAAYLILRRVGLSINQISKAFGRSTSVVHRVIVKAEKYGHNLDVWLRRRDIRKLPRNARLLTASFQWSKLLTLLSQWESWICGEEEKPP